MALRYKSLDENHGRFLMRMETNECSKSKSIGRQFYREAKHEQRSSLIVEIPN